MLAVIVAMMTAVSMVCTGFAQIAPDLSQEVSPLPTTAIVVGGVPLTVEVASDPAALALGLGGRDGLAPGTGMLFVFDGPAVRSFWMKGMRFCLDIIWIEGGVIQGVTEGVCPAAPGTLDDELPGYGSPSPVSYVLEVPADWSAANGLGIGTKVTGLP